MANWHIYFKLASKERLERQCIIIVIIIICCSPCLIEVLGCTKGTILSLNNRNLRPSISFSPLRPSMNVAW